MPMPTKKESAGAAAALARKRRLHPLAIFNPFGGYSRPPRLGWRVPNLKAVSLAALVAVVLVIDYQSDSVSVTEEGGLIIQRSEVTWTDLLILLALAGILAACIARWWTFQWLSLIHI